MENFNYEAERCLLSAVIRDPSLLDKVLAWIRSPAAISPHPHRKIWETILDIRKSDSGLDLVILNERLEDKYNGDVDPEYLASLGRFEVNADNTEQYCKIVWGRYIKSKTLDAAEKLKSATSGDSSTIQDILLEEQRNIEELINLQPTRDKSFDVVLEDSIRSILSGSHITSFGLPYLDGFSGGMTRGELTAIGGRPGHGKTTMVLNILDSLAREGHKIILFNREMTNTQTIQKLLVMNSEKLQYDHMRKRMLGKDTIENIANLKSLLKERYRNVRMYDSIRELGESILEIKRWEPDIFIDDYIQLVRVGKVQDRRFDIEDIMTEYKWVAKKTGASGILVSQLNRDIERRLDPAPTMGDYAEGGTIEQMSETCLFVNYPYIYDSLNKSKTQVEIIAKKVRYGSIGKYTIHYDGSKCRYSL